MTGFSRRHFMTLLAGSACLVSLRPSLAQDAHSMHGNHAAPQSAGEIDLPIPPLLEADANGVVALTIAKGRHSFAPGQDAASAGINGSYLGPTIRLNNGDKVTLAVHNAMDEETTLHWHGLFVPSSQDGGPHNVIAAGGSWQPKVQVNQPASFNWFHPHLHGHTARQAHLGIAGLMIVRDGRDGERGLPDNYGVDDIPLVLQDRRVIAGDQVYQPDVMDFMHGFRGDRLIVNGVINPRARVPAGIVRLRLLNGANARIFAVKFDNDMPFRVVASDGGYIAAPEELSVLTISPGERFEILADFSAVDKAVSLLTMREDASGEADILMRFELFAQAKAAITTMPETLDGPAVPELPQDLPERSFTFDERMAENMQVMMRKPANDPHAGHAMPGMKTGTQDHGKMEMSGHAMSKMPDMAAMMDHSQHGGRSANSAGPALDALTSGIAMAIAGQPFDMQRIDVEARLGSQEIWTLTTQQMAHPFHIHGASFRVLSLDGKAPPAHLSGWKDTVLVNQQAKLLVRFDREASRQQPFMFHCHVLEHEDVGMMGQFITL